MSKEKDTAHFGHPLNIIQGFGRVIYAETLREPDGSIRMPEGWVLPGGRRTQSESEAKAVAAEINAITARQMKRTPGLRVRT